IEDIFLDLQQKFGFQRDSVPLTLHADYIEGLRANYRKWYFAAQLDLDNAVGHTQNQGLQRLRSKWGSGRSHSEKSLASA
ncbi:hypothetical protein BJV77DRAFT_910318, partial [Russula vinacea]